MIFELYWFYFTFHVILFEPMPLWSLLELMKNKKCTCRESGNRMGQKVTRLGTWCQTLSHRQSAKMTLKRLAAFVPCFNNLNHCFMSCTSFPSKSLLCSLTIIKVITHQSTTIYKILLTCVLSNIHVKFYIFKDIFSEIEKIVITFSIFEILFSKIKINMCL